MPDNDIIEKVRAAEAEVQQAVEAAEEERRKAVAEAEEQRVKAVAEAKVRLQQEYAAAVDRAKSGAAENEKHGGSEAAAEADALKQVPADRMEKAVERVVEALHQKWQSTE